MKKILFICLICSLLNSCKDRDSTKNSDSDEQAQIAETRTRQIVTQVSELCSRYNAITDWHNKLDIEEASFDTVLYSIDVQNVLLDPNERPYLFFVAIADIKKVKDEYILIADQFQTVNSRRDINIHLRLVCDAEKVQRILEQKPSYFDRYAILATIRSIEKPALDIRPDIEYDLLAENDTFAETHPDDIYDYLDLKITCENYNTFIAIGKCEALVFVGQDDWMDEPSDYERFIESFNVNVP